MEPLKYKVIKTKKQYYEYCNLVEKISCEKKKHTVEEIELMELLVVLIEKYDAEHSTLVEIDPVGLLRLFMEDHKMRSVDLANLLGVSTSLVSDVLNYRRGFSKTMITKLSARFKIDPKALMKPYRLNPPGSSSTKAKKDPKAPKPGPVKKPAKANKATAHK